MFEHESIEAQRERLNHAYTHPEVPVSHVTNHYYNGNGNRAAAATKAPTNGLLFLAVAIALSAGAALAGMQVGYARAQNDVVEARAEAAAQAARVAAVKACVEAIQ